MSTYHCSIDGYPLESSTDGNGNTVVHCEACRRRRARRCMDCGQPVRGRSWRCEKHKGIKRDETRRLHERRNREERNAADRQRYWADKERRRRRCEQKKEWRRRNRMKVAMQKRRGRLKGTNGYKSREKYLEYQAEYNAQRAEEKRRYMRTKAVWFGRNPRCAKCGGIIAWGRRGRPKKYHSQCNPWTKGKVARPGTTH